MLRLLLKWRALALMAALMTPQTLQTVHSATSSASSLALCALSPAQLALRDATLCLASDGSVEAACRFACACRQQDEARSTPQSLFALCVAEGSSACQKDAVNCSSSVLQDQPKVLEATTKDAETAPTPTPTPSANQTHQGSASGDGDKKKSMSKGAIAGIVVGAAVALGIIIFIVNWFRNRPTKGDNRDTIQLASMNTKNNRPSPGPLSNRSRDPTRPTASSDGAAYQEFDNTVEMQQLSRDNLNNMGLDVSQGPLHISHLVSSQDIRVQPPPRAFSPRSDSDDGSLSSSSVDIDGDSFYHSRHQPHAPIAPPPRKKSIEF